MQFGKIAGLCHADLRLDAVRSSPRHVASDNQCAHQTERLTHTPTQAVLSGSSLCGAQQADPYIHSTTTHHTHAARCRAQKLSSCDFLCTARYHPQMRATKEIVCCAGQCSLCDGTHYSVA